MRERTRFLTDVAEAIADRTPIDWAAIKTHPPQAADSLIGALRSIEDVASRSAGAHGTAATELRPLTPPRWVLAVAALSIAVVVAGLEGTLLGVPSGGVVPIGLQAVCGLVFGAAGAWLLVAPGDGRGVWLGGWLLTMAAAVSHRPMLSLLPLLASHAHLQAVLSGLVPEVFMPVFLALFARGFPRAPRWSSTERLANATIRVASMTALLGGLGHVLAAALSPSAPHTASMFGWMARAHPSGFYWFLILLPTGMSLLPMLARGRLAEEEERRRLSLFAMGVALGLAPTIVVIVLGSIVPSIDSVLEGQPGFRVLAFLTYGLALTMPFTTAHAVRTHHVSSVGFVVHRALHRLLARSTLTFLTLAPVALLVGHMFRNREQSLTMLFSGADARFSLLLTVLGLLGIAARIPLLNRLNRALTPRRGDWRTSLVRANQNLLRARGTQEMLELLMREVEATLRARGCLMIPVVEGYVSLRGRVPRVPRESALFQVARSAEGPFLVDPSSPSSIFRWLPDSERSIVVDGGVAVILPVPGAGDEPRALLAIEASSEGEPYSTDDFLYLGALATAGSIALGSARANRHQGAPCAAIAEEPAGECGACGLLYADPSGPCECGSPLQSALLPILLNGKFRLTRRLGSGAMGVAYEAEDLDLARTVALKTLPRVSPYLALRLRQEARSMARVLHPRLAMIFGCESWRGVPVLVLEHLAGTLAGRVDCPWRIREALALGVAAAEGLAAMHDHGLLHRDIKPSNVGFAHDGGVKLLDFGIAHLLTEAVDHGPLGGSVAHERPLSATDLDLSSRAIGTPLYCSPERLGGCPARPADDVWSLSVLIYELIAGIHPWRRRGEFTESTGPIPDLRELRRDCPEEVACFFSRALAVRSADRLTSARDLQQTAMALVTGQPLTDTWPD